MLLTSGAFRPNSYDILMGSEMNRVMHGIKQEAFEETDVCLTCHRRFNVNKLKKHSLTTHNGKTTQFCDRVLFN